MNVCWTYTESVLLYSWFHFSFFLAKIGITKAMHEGSFRAHSIKSSVIHIDIFCRKECQNTCNGLLCLTKLPELITNQRGIRITNLKTVDTCELRIPLLTSKHEHVLKGHIPIGCQTAWLVIYHVKFGRLQGKLLHKMYNTVGKCFIKLWNCFSKAWMKLQTKKLPDKGNPCLKFLQ